MKTTSGEKTWSRTRLQNLVKHKSGSYYARLFRDGKEIWKSLKTKSFSVAEARLAEAQKEHRQRKHTLSATLDAKLTFDQAAAIHLDRVKADVSTKRRTKDYWHEIYKGIKKHWNELPTIQVRQLSKSTLLEWASRFAKVSSSTRFNNSIAFIRHVLEVAVESGVIAVNPGQSLERKPVKPKILELPTLAQFSALIAEMSIPKGRYSLASADLAQGLAYTGCRISEARRITWGDLNFAAEMILVKGDPEEGTKNGEVRRVPMIASAKRLFQRMRSERLHEPENTPVFQVGKCQESMDKAMQKLGIPRMTHHDLRHFFATVCIESGVDIPTVSRWLGHKDGGALAMRVYGHLRNEHSLAAARKVSFAA